MLTVVVGATFHGTIAPAPPVRDAEDARAGARAREPVRRAALLRALRRSRSLSG